MALSENDPGDQYLMPLSEFKEKVIEKETHKSLGDKVRDIIDVLIHIYKGTYSPAKDPDEEIEIDSDELQPFPFGSHLYIYLEVLKAIVNKIYSVEKVLEILKKIVSLTLKKGDAHPELEAQNKEIQRILDNLDRTK